MFVQQKQMQKRDNLDAINQDAFNLNLSHILTYPAVQEHFFST